jgi:hypothetical protein
MPRILATILNETIVAGMVVLLHRRRTARPIPCRALTIFPREGYFWHRSMTGSQTGLRLPTCKPREPRSTRSRSVSPNACLPATAMRAKFALALPSGSRPGATVPLPLIDVRVQWSARHQDNAAQHAPMREFLLRTLSRLSDALASAQWREDWIPPAILDHDRFRQAPMPADR